MSAVSEGVTTQRLSLIRIQLELRRELKLPARLVAVVAQQARAVVVEAPADQAQAVAPHFNMLAA
jgi:hypothetical protein